MSAVGGVPPGGATRRELGRQWPLVAELFCGDAAREWDWEGIRVGGKLHVYCYLRDCVVALAPFDLED